jgi:hypothetical protein
MLIGGSIEAREQKSSTHNDPKRKEIHLVA